MHDYMYTIKCRWGGGGRIVNVFSRQMLTIQSYNCVLPNVKNVLRSAYRKHIVKCAVII